MMSSKHVDQLLPDYSLQLLNQRDEKMVTEHLTVCSDCRRALHHERALMVEIRETLDAATKIDHQYLQEFMPVPSTKGQFLQNLGWRRQLAFVSFFILFILASLTLQRQLSTDVRVSTAPVFYQPTVAATETPTQTVEPTRLGATASPQFDPTPIARSATHHALPALAPVPSASLFH